jgi:hypothetical protein
MNTKRLLLAFGLGLGLALLALAATSQRPTRAQATCDRYVLSIGGSNSSDCSDEQHPCKTVQHAIGQAAEGDVICIAKHILAGPLTYAERLVITRSITLDGAWDAMCVDPSDLKCSFTAIACNPGNVTLDAEGAGRVISITGHITPVIDCFTITGGDAGGEPGGPNKGGGIYSQDAAPIIVNNIITDNYGCTTFACTGNGRGGGIYLLNAPATAVISNNLIAHNVADDGSWGQGGGILLRNSDAQVLSNTIERNRSGLTAGNGGGVAVVDGSPTIADNDFVWNVAGQGVMGSGGGIYVRSSTPVTIERNLLKSNHALNGPGDPSLTSKGGGIYYAGSPTVSAVIRDNTILYNMTVYTGQQGEGGGMYFQGLVNPSLVSGNTLDGNIADWMDEGIGGGMYVNDSEVTIIDNRVLDNSATWVGDWGEGGGIYLNGGIVLLLSNVITGNAAAYFGPPSVSAGWGGGVAISGSLATVQDNWIVDNTGTRATSGSGGVGGGIFGHRGTLYIAGNTIAENHTSAGDWGLGGGLYLLETRPWLEGNTILDNEAAAGIHGRGGGMRIWDCPTFTLTNNIVARNDASESGSGVLIESNSTGRLYHNTIADNLAGDGVGVYVNSGSDVVLYNNIVVNHTVGITIADPPTSSVGAKYTLFESNGTDYGPGVGSSYEIPGPAALLADYHLGSGSGAINQAPNLNWAPVNVDIDGDPRPIGPARDVGADEAWLWRFLPLVTRGYP